MTDSPQARWQRNNRGRLNIYRSSWLDNKRQQPETWQHGKLYTYELLECRCNECWSVAHEKYAEQYAKKKANVSRKT